MKVINLVIIVFCISSAVSAKCLMDGKIKYIHHKKDVVLSTKYCFSQAHIVSLNCIESKCLASKSYKVSKQGGTPVGNPLFSFCISAKGTPQIMWFWNELQWVKSSRCIFKDGSYIDLDRLYANRYSK